MAKKTSKIPSSVLGRASKLLMTSGNLVGRELGGRLSARMRGESSPSLKTRMSQAREIVETLGNMKGAAMKIGQFLSIEFADLLPPEVLEVLRKLHDDSTFLGFKDIEKILQSALGPEKFAAIKDLSEEPIAAASIGQVHSATINGKRVAIKIQFPGVADTLESDITLIKKLASTAISIAGKEMNLDHVFTEIAASLRQEVDYLQEAQHLKTYKEAFENDERYRIPDLIEDFTTRNVLTMSFEEGVRLNDWLKEDVPKEERQLFAENIFSLLTKEIFEVGIVQTDANYGNFLYNRERRQIVLLDFGATKSYDLEARYKLRNLFAVGLGGSQEELLEESYSQGLLDRRESDLAKSIFLDFMEIIIDIITEELQPYDFSDLNNIERLRKYALQLSREVVYTTPVKNMVLLNRKLGGIYHLLREAGSQIDLHKHFLRVQKMDLGSAPKAS
jgi:aarF domain-containing kinase